MLNVSILFGICIALSIQTAFAQSVSLGDMDSPLPCTSVNVSSAKGLHLVPAPQKLYAWAEIRIDHPKGHHDLIKQCARQTGKEIGLSSIVLNPKKLEPEFETALGECLRSTHKQTLIIKSVRLRTVSSCNY